MTKREAAIISAYTGFLIGELSEVQRLKAKKQREKKRRLIDVNQNTDKVLIK